MANDTEPAQATARPEQLTEYVVLEQRGPGAGDMDLEQLTWMEVRTVTAPNAQAAVKQATDGEGTFVAVPARSWKPLTRKVETVQRDVWS